jgi:hypothetical protein
MRSHNAPRAQGQPAGLTPVRPSATLQLVNMTYMFTNCSEVPGDEMPGAPTPVAAGDPHRDLGTATMHADANPLLDGPCCPCGAQADGPHIECRKCRARGRWARRTAGRTARHGGGRS